MKLPEVNKTLRRMYSRQREQIAFNGLDLRESARAGALTDCTNLSTVRWPSLSPRQGRATLAQWENATAAFAWDGDLISVRDGILYCDEDPIVNVVPGEKQFAVVNTKLCVWPDKLAVDLTNQEYERLDADVLADPTAHSVSITGNSLTADMRPNPFTDVCGTRLVINAATTQNPSRYSFFVYTYGDGNEPADVTALEACYSEGTG